MMPLFAVGLLLAALSLPTAARAQSCAQNAAGPDELLLVLTQQGTDFDLGWTGIYHDLDVPGGAQFRLCLSNCDTTTDSLCDVQGQAGDATVAGRNFAPPIPLMAGGFATCIVTTFEEPFATGTADVSTGAIDITAGLSANVHLTAPTAVCPQCSGATPGASGTCAGGATPGGSCVTHEVITVAGAIGDTTYQVSRDCLPAGFASSVEFTVNATTDTSTLAGLCPGQTGADDCAAACGTTCTPGTSGISQNCCTTEQSKRCFPTPIERGGGSSIPLPQFPDPMYPKTAAEVVVGTFCAPTSGSGTLDAAVGLPGPAAFELRVDTQWLLESPASGTTTSTTTVGGGTTSTSLPSTCTSAAECNDGDPCTTDDCPAGTCTNAQQTGISGADCELADFLARPPCTLDAKLLTAATTLVGKARAAVQSLQGASGKAVTKAKKKADNALKKLGKKAKKAAKKTGRITPAGCEATLAQTIATLRALVAAL